MPLKVVVKSDIREKANQLRKTGESLNKNFPKEVFKILSLLEAAIKQNIRFRSGLKVRSGSLLNSIQKDIQVNGDKVTGTVGSYGVPYASTHEFGADMPARVIHPRNSKALRWFDNAGNPVFAKKVEIPSYRIPARPFIQPAIDQIAPQIEDKFATFIEFIASKEN